MFISIPCQLNLFLLRIKYVIKILFFETIAEDRKYIHCIFDGMLLWH